MTGPRWRTGRHNDRIVYEQSGPEPSDDDRMVATFFEAGDAARAVAAERDLAAARAEVEKLSEREFSVGQTLVNEQLRSERVDAERDAARSQLAEAQAELAKLRAEAPAVQPVEAPTEEDDDEDQIEPVPISPEFRAQLIEAVGRPLRVRSHVLLLAAHATGHLAGPGRGCRKCHADWPCPEVNKAAAPALEAFADSDAHTRAGPVSQSEAPTGGQ